VTGNVDIQSGIRSLTLGDLLDDASSPAGVHTTPNTIHLGTSPYASGILPAVQFGAVNDYSLTADLKVASLAANSWVDVHATGEAISAPGMGSLHITGDLQASVTVNAATVPAAHAGALTSPVKSFVVGGDLLNSTVQIAGDVTSVSLGAMNHSNFIVGGKQSSGTPVIPAQRADFASIHTIGSFVITGAGQTATAADMVASTVAAAKFGSIVVNKPDTAPETGNFGFIAETIAKYSDPTKPTSLTNPGPGTYDQQGNYLVTVLAS